MGNPHDEYLKILLKNRKADVNKGENIPCSWIGWKPDEHSTFPKVTL